MKEQDKAVKVSLIVGHSKIAKTKIEHKEAV